MPTFGWQLIHILKRWGLHHGRLVAEDGRAVEEKPHGGPPEHGQPHVPEKGGPRLGPAVVVLAEVLSDEELEAILRAGIARAIAGDVRWAELILGYVEGRPIARLEVGMPGAFAAPDAAELTAEELKAYIVAATARLARDGDEQT